MGNSPFASRTRTNWMVSFFRYFKSFKIKISKYFFSWISLDCNWRDFWEELGTWIWCSLQNQEHSAGNSKCSVVQIGICSLCGRGVPALQVSKVISSKPADDWFINTIVNIYNLEKCWHMRKAVLFKSNHLLYIPSGRFDFDQTGEGGY